MPLIIASGDAVLRIYARKGSPNGLFPAQVDVELSLNMPNAPCGYIEAVFPLDSFEEGLGMRLPVQAYEFPIVDGEDFDDE